MAAGAMSAAAGAAAAQAAAMMQQQAQAAQVQALQPQALQRVASGSAGPSGVVAPVVTPGAPQGLAQAAPMAAAPGAQQKVGGGLPMAELIQVIREHPQLRTQIQEIVQRKDLAEKAKMEAIQRIVREAQPPPAAAAAPPPPGPQP